MKLDRAANWVEIVANVGVIITLVLLVAEVRNNTLALERQTLIDRSGAMNDAFLENPVMPEILANIKALDGWESAGYAKGVAYETAFAERYDVPIEQGIVWARFLSMLWSGLNADYTLLGESEELARRIRLLLQFPDQQLFWKHLPAVLTEDFRAYVERLRREEDSTP